jgi:HK97 family phage prohead protease
MAELNGRVRRTVVTPNAVRFLGVGVSDRQVRVVASDESVDRMGDILIAKGCQLSDYRKNPVVLAQHRADSPIARCSSIGLVGNRIEATIDFPPSGTSVRSDEYLGLLKNSVLGAVSVGFLPSKYTTRKEGGYLFSEWELLELSVVSVPANQSALVIERSAELPDAAQSDLERRVAYAKRIGLEALLIAEGVPPTRIAAIVDRILR